MATRYVKSKAALIAAYRAAKRGESLRIGDWTKPVWTAEEFLSWFRTCLENKINSHDPRQPRGRKAEGEYQIELGRLRMYVGNRIVISWVAPVLGGRVRKALASRMRGRDDV